MAPAGKSPFPRTVIHPQFHPVEPHGSNSPPIPPLACTACAATAPAWNASTNMAMMSSSSTKPSSAHSGDIVFTVWPHALPHGLDHARHTHHRGHNAWHIAPDRSGDGILCDTNHPDRGMQIIDAETGALRHLCLSESTNQGTPVARSSYALPEDFAAARSANPAI